MTIFLKTKRLILKPTTMAELNNLYQLQTDADVMKYIGVRNMDEVKKFLENTLAHHNKHHFSFCSMYEAQDHTFIGQAGIMYLEYDDTQSNIEIGYRLYKKFWNKGYATEVSKALIKWGFEHLPVDKLTAVIHPENEGSRHVLEKVGMHYVGRVHCYDHEMAQYEILKNTIDFSEIKLVPATMEDYEIIKNMAAYYSYDMSKYMDWPQEPDGTQAVGIDYKKYFGVQDTFPFLIKYKGELVGFAIVDKKVTQPNSDFNMAQFFILKKFQEKGVGKQVAFECFNQFQGTWEVYVMSGNEGAYRFWRSVIKQYTKNHFNECSRIVNQSYRNIFLFRSY